MQQYKSIKKKTQIELIIKKSKFIGYLFPVKDETDVEEKLEEIRQIHKDANHNCFAYRLGIKGQLQKASDDGEPQGTAGVPMLEILNKEEITNVLAVVTRYFGGVKLGAGGLIRAYSQTVKETLNNSEIVLAKLYWQGKLSVDYKDVESIKNTLLNEKVQIEEIDYLERVFLTILIPTELKEEINNKILNLTRGEEEVEFIKKKFLT